MALSEDEQHQLDQLDHLTWTGGPESAADPDPMVAQRREQWQIGWAWTALLLGILAMLTGVGAAQGLISTGTIVAGYGFLLTGWAAGAIVTIIRLKFAAAGKRTKWL